MNVKPAVAIGFVVAAVLAAVSLAPLSASASSFAVINTNDSGTGSLRQAIINANSSSGSDTITFAIGSGGPVTISPTSALPPVTSPVTLDGTSQPGYSGVPLIDISGSHAGSGSRGLYISGSARGSVVKGLVINRFSAQGIFIDTSNITIQNDYVGTTADGLSGAGNGGDGVAIFSGTSAAAASNNIVGGTSAAQRNIISGNGGNGVGITAQDGGTASSNTVEGNFIGADANGTGPIGNVGDGILVNNAEGAGTIQGTIIGGSTGTTPGASCAGACNLIAANGANGIGLWHQGVTASVVAGNYVGTDLSGANRLGNSNIGIEVNETANNTIGGTTPAARNIFSGNGGAGVFLTGASATGNAIEGNYIGTNAAGTAGISNLRMGVGVGNSPGDIGANSDTIGGTAGVTPGGACTGACNVISGNAENGIYIHGAESYGFVIVGNFIGLNAAGTQGIGNVSDGIGLQDTPNTRIGGSTSAERNVISSNGANGVTISGSPSTGDLLSQNFIGETTTGQSSGNTRDGVSILGSTYDIMTGNSIAFNGGLGIDLDGGGSPILNDDADGDGGANHHQNFPMVYAARTAAGVTKIGGELNSTPLGNYRLDFFESDGCNAGAPNDYGEGQTYIGSRDVNTDQFGNTAFGFTSPTAIPGNKYITATATKESGGNLLETSEFSQCVLVNASKPALTNGATWYLKIGLTSGGADHTFGYGFPTYFLMCAWDPNQPGVKLPVIYTGGTWLMRASYTTGVADLTVNFGDGSDKPVCGDWDGDGTDTIGYVDPSGNWSMRNTNTPGSPDIGPFQFGVPGASPIAGDWNGDGTDTVGYVTSDGTWNLRNSNSTGAADISFQFGAPGATPIVGDWDGDGVDTVGTVTSGQVWTIRNSNSAGPSNGQFTFGFAGASPLIW